MTESKQKLAEELINRLIEKINYNAILFEGWGKAFQIMFTDINVGYWIKVAMDGNVEKTENAIKKNEAVATIYWTTDTMRDVFDKKIGPMEAMNTGAIRIDGALTELLKLNPILS